MSNLDRDSCIARLRTVGAGTDPSDILTDLDIASGSSINTAFSAMRQGSMPDIETLGRVMDRDSLGAVGVNWRFISNLLEAGDDAIWSRSLKGRLMTLVGLPRRRMRTPTAYTDSSNADLISDVLPPSDVLICYIQTEADILVFVVRCDEYHKVVLPIHRMRLAGQLGSLLGPIAVVRSDAHLLTNDQAADLRALHEMLIVPIRPFLSRATRIHIMASGDVSACPFAALVDESGRFLIETYAIDHVPSLTIAKATTKYERDSKALAESRRAGVKARRPVLLGDPDGTLPYARLECEELYIRFIDWEPIPLIGSDASIAALREWGTSRSRCNILHIAAHARTNAERPQLGYLQLAPTARDSGRLFAEEIPHLDCDVDLVTLSACVGGRSALSAGDQPNSLATAFLLGGARCVLSSLWPIDDAYTGQFMRDFYDEIHEKPKSECLRRAMLSAIQRQRSPFYWAGFMVTGSSQPVSSVVVV